MNIWELIPLLGHGRDLGSQQGARALNQHGQRQVAPVGEIMGNAVVPPLAKVSQS